MGSGFVVFPEETTHLGLMCGAAGEETPHSEKQNSVQNRRFKVSCRLALTSARNFGTAIF